MGIINSLYEYRVYIDSGDVCVPSSSSFFIFFLLGWGASRFTSGESRKTTKVEGGTLKKGVEALQWEKKDP